MPKYLSESQVKKLVDDIKDERFRNLVIFYLATGCRRDEALNLIWKDVDLKNKKVVFRETKSGKSRFLPINKNLLIVLKRMSNTKKQDERLFEYNSDYVTHKIKKHLKNIGFNSRISVHCLRHTFASHLVMSGVDIYTVSKLLGHSDIKVTEIYSHLAPDYLKSSIEKLNYLSPICH